MIKPLNTKLWIEPNIKGPISQYSNYNHYYHLSEHLYIIINGLTGAVDAVSDVIYSKIINVEISALRIQHFTEFNYLISRGYIIDSKESENEIKNELVNSLIESAKLLDNTFMICPTDFCSMGCKYCFTHKFTKESEKITLSNEQITAIFLKMNDISDGNPNSQKLVVLYGGEPFQPYTLDTIEFILYSAKKNGFQVAGFSNGYYLDLFIPLLTKYQEVIKILSVTIDPPSLHNQKRAMKDSFETAVKNIDILQNIKNFHIQLKSNVDINNIGLIPEIIQFYKQKNWWLNPNITYELNPIRYGNLEIKDCSLYDAELSIKVIQLLKENDEINRFDILPIIDYKYYYYEAFGIYSILDEKKIEAVKVPKAYHCPSVSGHVFIFDANGNVFLCNEEIGNKDQIFGSYINNNYILQKNKFDAYTNRKIGNLEICDDCKFSFVCGGGCACYSKVTDNVKCPTIKTDISSIIAVFKNDIINHLTKIENV